MKTKNLTGRALDYAVALAEGHKLCDWYGRGCTKFNGLQFMLPNGGYRPYILDSDITRKQIELCEDSPLLANQRYWQPTRAVEGDDIIDREKISTEYGHGMHGKHWRASMPVKCYALPSPRYTHDGATRREAAMRCYVASKLGAEVEIPEELK